MPPKRKRSSNKSIYNPPKRTKRSDTTEDREVEESIEESEDSELYPIKDILDEREGEYQIDWKGKDPRTKKPWEPTWNRNATAVWTGLRQSAHPLNLSTDTTQEPKGYATQAAIDAWERKREQDHPTPSPHLIGIPSETSRPSTPRETSRKRRPQTPSSRPPQQPRPPPARSRYIIPSDSPSVPTSSVGSVKQGANHPGVQDSPVSTNIRSLEVQIPQIGSQEKQGYIAHQSSNQSYQTQSSYDHQDSGIGSLSPENEPLRGAQAPTTVVSGTSTESLAPLNLSNERRTTATASAESDSLFIPDSRPSQDFDISADFEDFDAAVNAVQQSPPQLPDPQPEVDLDDLEPVSPSRQLTDDLRASQASPRPLSPHRRAARAATTQSSAEATHVPEASHAPLGLFSQGFSSPEQNLLTQFPPNQLQPRLDCAVADDTTESAPSLDPSQERPALFVAPDRVAQVNRAEEENTRHVSEERIPEARDNSSPAPITLQVIDNLRKSLEDRITLRPVTPRTQMMDNSNPNARATPGTNQSLTERMRSLREEMDIHVSTSADPSGSATPSGPPTAIPDKPVAEQPLSEGPIPLSQRVVSTSPPTFVRPMDLGFDDTDMILMQGPAPKSFKFGQEQYAIPVPIEAIAKDEYLRQIGASAPAFRSLLGVSSDDSTISIAAEMQQVSTALQSLHQIIAHTDLNIQGTATQRPVAATTVADWSGLTSQKFYFLRLFLDCSKHLEKRVCIVAQEGRLLDILETFLRGRNIAHSRPGKPTISPISVNEPLIVDLLSMADLTRTVLSKPDLIIAFDTSFDSENAAVQRLRGDILKNNHRKLVPVVHLLAPFSVEHVERCLPAKLQGLPRQQALVKATLKYSTVIGGMRNNDDDPDNGYPVDEYALMLMSFLDSNEWPDEGPEMPALELDFASDESSPTREPVRPTISGAHSRSMTPGGHKRSLSRDFETPMIISTSKRQRLTPLGDLTHVSDSVHGSQLERTLRETQQRFDDVRLENLEQAKQIKDLQTALAHNESAMQDYTKQIGQLRDTASTSTLRLQEHVLAHGQLQHRYEFRINEVHKLRNERDALVEKISGLEIKRDNTIKENTKMKEERAQLQSDLLSARNDLKSAGGTTAELEVLREDNRRLAKEKAVAEKRYVSSQSDLDFTRQLYQEVSTKVASTANENGRLELENQDLKRKGENAAAHLKNLSAQRETDSHLRRTEELQATLASRDELLRRKEEEVRELRKGRGMGTRASSVQPRSPRLGNSRPVSPAPGNLVPMQMARGASALRYPQEFR